MVWKRGNVRNIHPTLVEEKYVDEQCPIKPIPTLIINAKLLPA